MDNFKINISPENHRIDISRGEPINITVNQELIKIDKKIETFELNYDGPVVNIDARYDEAVRIITEGLENYNENAQEKTTAYNTNASEKLSNFNDNYTAKKALIDTQVDIAEEQANIAISQAQTATVQAGIAATQASEASTSASNAVISEQNASTSADNASQSALNAATSEANAGNSASTATAQAGIATTKAGEASVSATNASNSALSASNSADLAKQWAIGDPSEPVGNSSKYWAEQAQAQSAGLTSRVFTIEQKIPSTASSSNQLVDKSYVDTEDNNLQSQIDAIVASSDVYDIVGTYAELQAYDISTVPVNDIIKVLVDSTHSNAAAYYRCVESGGIKSWSYIGSEGAYYTKGEADGKFSTILATGSALDYTGTTLSLENAQGTVLSSVTIKSTPDLDNKSISLNSSDELQAIGVINQNNTTQAIKIWTGTKAQYYAIATKDSTTLYNITDDTSISLTILEALYPVGSIYITTASTCPLNTLISGSTWELVSSGRVLQGADSGHSAGTTVEAGLPNITGEIRVYSNESDAGIEGWSGAFGRYNKAIGTHQYNSTAVATANFAPTYIDFDASRSSSIYGNSTTVQPPAYIVNIFRRTN